MDLSEDLVAFLFVTQIMSVVIVHINEPSSILLLVELFKTEYLEGIWQVRIFYFFVPKIVLLALYFFSEPWRCCI